MTTPLDPRTHELHNVEVRDGRCFVRPGLNPHTTLAANYRYVGGFSVEDSATTEVWHYLAIEYTPTGVVSLTVTDEEIDTIFSLRLGKMKDPTITWGVKDQQLWIGSPSFPALYGVVGSGLIPAEKTDPLNPESVALDIPRGVSCVWKDRVVVAVQDNVLINSGALDPRTFTTNNVFNVQGRVTDLFEGPDGALWIFTTEGAYVLPADALSQSQIPVSFVGTVPGVSCLRSRNAITTCGMVLALGRDGLILVGTDTQKRLDITPYEGLRDYSPPVEVQDYRAEARLFPHPNGAIVAVGGPSPFALLVDLRNGFNSYLWFRSTSAEDEIVGMLRSRDGDPLYLTRTRVLEMRGNFDPDGNQVRGVACARMPIPADESRVLRRVTIAADNVGQATHVYAAGLGTSRTTPATSRDTIVGTSLWDSASTYGGRTIRTNRHSYPGIRTHDVLVEYAATGSYRHMSLSDVEYRGQAPGRRSAGA